MNRLHRRNPDRRHSRRTGPGCLSSRPPPGTGGNRRRERKQKAWPPSRRDAGDSPKDRKGTWGELDGTRPEGAKWRSSSGQDDSQQTAWQGIPQGTPPWRSPVQERTMAGIGAGSQDPRVSGSQGLRVVESNERCSCRWEWDGGNNRRGGQVTCHREWKEENEKRRKRREGREEKKEKRRRWTKDEEKKPIELRSVHRDPAGERDNTGTDYQPCTRVVLPLQRLC